MTKKLFCQAIIKFIMGVLIVGVLVFLPAGTFDYWQAWLLIAILFIPMFFAGYDVGVDANDFYLVSIEQVKNFFEIGL